MKMSALPHPSGIYQSSSATASMPPTTQHITKNNCVSLTNRTWGGAQCKMDICKLLTHERPNWLRLIPWKHSILSTRTASTHTQEMRRLEESVREEARRELASEASRAEREIGRLQARRRDLTARSHREISPRDLTARWRVRAPARWPRDGPEMARDEARSACRRLR